jgi:hypothetical protein
MAGYAHELLKNISDSKPLGAHLGKAPVHELLKGYKKLAENDDNVPLITEENTGWDFKEALDQLPVIHQIALYYPYLRDTLPNFEEENPAEVRSRIRMREWYIKLAIYTCIGAAGTLAGATLALAVREGKAPSSELIQTFLDFAMELAKAIFETTKA